MKVAAALSALCDERSSVMACAWFWSRPLVRSVYFLRYACEYFHHALLHQAERRQGVCYAHKRHDDVIVFAFERGPQHVLVRAVGLTHQPLHPVAVNGMPEPFLGHGDEYRHWWQRVGLVILVFGKSHKNSSQGKCCHRSISSCEKFVYDELAVQSLRFLESVVHALWYEQAVRPYHWRVFA